MNRRQKTAGWLVVTAALTTAMTACTNDDNIIDVPTTTGSPKTYTLTIEATIGNDDDATRALSLDGKTLNATWTEGDEVEVYQGKVVYSPEYRSYSEKIGTLTAQSSGASTTLTGTVTLSSPANLTLYYGSPSYDYSGQVGTLDDIAARFDYATTMLTKSRYTLSGSNIVLNEGVTLNFSNQQAIVKFSLKDADGNAITTSSRTVGATDN